MTVEASEPAPLMQVKLVPKTYGGGYHVTCNGTNDAVIQTVVTDREAPYTYVWSTSNGTAQANGVTTETLEHVGAGIYTVVVTDHYGVTATASIELLQPKLLHVEATSKLQEGGTHVSKAGGSDGSASAEVNGGTPPYEYLWSTTDGTADANGATKEKLEGLTVGTYTVTVTGMNGCTSSSTVTLTEPTPLTATLVANTYPSGHHVSCAKGEDGAMDLTVSGGIPPYKFDWSSGHFTEDVTGLKAGYHEVRITDANGAEVAIGETLTEPDPISIVLTSPLYPNGYNVSCHACYNGSVSSTVGGGAGGYAYNWVGSAGSVGSGTELTNVGEKDYGLEITDANSCIAKEVITLKIPERDDWTMSGNGGIGPDNFIGTTDANDLVLKANNEVQLRLGANGITEVVQQLRLSGVPSIDAEAQQGTQVLVLNSDGTVSAGAPPAPPPPDPDFPWIPNQQWDCWDVTGGSMMGQWHYDMNKIVTCPPINVGIGIDEPMAKLDVRNGGIMVGYAPAFSAPFTDAALDVKGKTVISLQNSVGPTVANAMLDVRADGNAAAFTIDALDNDGLSSFRVRNNGKVVVNAGQFADPAIGKASLFLGNENYNISGTDGVGVGLSAHFSETYALYVADNSFDVRIPHRLDIGETRYTNGYHNDWKLCVDGKIVAKEIVVTTDEAEWSDYVFEDDYQLRSLKEVELFIKKNGHLPDVPSATEVGSKGQDLGEMNAILLRKIEELTLYEIELEKRLQE